MPSINHCMLAEQDDFAGRHRRIRVRSNIICRQCIENVLRLPVLYVAARHQLFDDLVKPVVRRPNRRNDATRMQFHMALLDTASHERMKRGKILRQPDGRHHRRQLLCGSGCRNRKSNCNCRIQGQGSANNSCLQRYFDLTEQLAPGANRPLRQRRI